MSKIGLVTVLYNSDAVLEDFFKSIAMQTYTNTILYIIDNSVNETTDNLLNRYFLQYPALNCRHIETGGNIGVAAGNNVGIHQAIADECSHVLLLNNDIDIEQDYLLDTLVKLATEKNENIIVPKILYYDNRKIWMAGGYMDHWRALGVHYGMNKADASEYNKPQYITYAPTCFMLINTAVFSTVGTMDEKYFAYYDDTDFVLRAVRSGLKLWYEPSLVVLHKVSSSSGGDNSLFYIYYGNRNKIYFIRKNYKGLLKWFQLFYTLLSRIAFYLKYDAAGKKKLVSALKAGFKIPVS